MPYQSVRWRKPPPVSCHTRCPQTSVSRRALRLVRAALDHPGRADQRYRRQQEHPVAQSRGDSAQWHQAGEPCQTLCPLARQRAHLGGGVLFTVCRELMSTFSQFIAVCSSAKPCAIGENLLSVSDPISHQRRGSAMSVLSYVHQLF